MEYNKLYSKDKQVSKYIKLDTPINGLDTVKVSVYFHKRDYQRNSCYMLSITPIEIIDREGYQMECQNISNGGILAIEYVDRYNAKKFNDVVASTMSDTSEDYKTLLTHIYSRQA